MGKSISHQACVYSVEKPNRTEPGFSPVYVNPIEAPDLPILESGCRTLYEAFLHTVQQHPSNPFLGTRKYLSSGSLGSFAWKTYSQILQDVQALASGFQKLNLLSKSFNLVGILSKNREEMVVMELACMSQNLPVVPLADNLTTDVLAGILTEARPTIVACGKAQCDLLISLQPECLLSIKSLIVFDSLRELIKNHLRSLGIEIYSYQEILQLSFEVSSANPPSPDSLAWILYTSGTAGYPRGAMLLHKNVLSTVLSMHKAGYIFSSTDSYLMYLPHSHIYDRIMTYVLIERGARIGFYSGDLLNIKEDLMLLKPTVFISVPRIFTRFYQTIQEKFAEKSGLSKKILNSSLKSKQNKYKLTGALNNGFWENLAFKKVRKSIGGRVKLMASASAPLNGEILKFLRIVFACPIVESLGITETAGACFVTQPSDTETDHIGGPLPGIEVKLRDIPEVGWTCNEDELTGELCLRSSSLFTGYYKGQDMTDRVVDSDGWYYSGDILTRNHKTGAFKIVGRLSNIIKLSQGEFVSIEKVEKVLLISQFVKQIFVYGDGFLNFLVAIVVPNKEFVLKNWMFGSIGKSSDVDWGGTVRGIKLKNEILEDFKELSMKNQLSKSETVTSIYLEENEWTDGDILTNTQKLNRLKAKLKYKEVIQQLASQTYNSI